MTEFLQRPHGEVAYDDSGGDRPLVVAAPGMGDLRASYRYLGPALRDGGYRFAAMDLRGVGESSVEWPDYSDGAIGGDIVALIEHLDTGAATVIGNSLTAASAAIAAVEAPQLVNALVLIGPFVRDVPRPVWQDLAFRVMLSPPWGRRAWASYYRKQMYPLAPPPDHDDYVSALSQNLAEPGRFRAFRALAFNSHGEADARLQDVAAPALVVMGTADPDFADPAAEAHLIGDRLGATVLLVEGAGHYPQAEAPEQVAPAVLDFLNEVDG